MVRPRKRQFPQSDQSACRLSKCAGIHGPLQAAIPFCREQARSGIRHLGIPTTVP